ncbi:hypothetical protein ACTHEH_001926, partial [Vibrio vulnificus]
FQIYFSGTYLNFPLAEALRCLPCQWMRIIGSFFTCTRAKLKKKEKKQIVCLLFAQVVFKNIKRGVSPLLIYYLPPQKKRKSLYLLVCHNLVVVDDKLYFLIR